MTCCYFVGLFSQPRKKLWTLSIFIWTNLGKCFCHVIILWETTHKVIVDAPGADLGGGSRGWTPPTPPEMTCGFLIQLVFCQKKKNYVVCWCWSRARDECTPSLKKNPGSALCTSCFCTCGLHFSVFPSQQKCQIRSHSRFCSEQCKSLENLKNFPVNEHPGHP